MEAVRIGKLILWLEVVIVAGKWLSGGGFWRIWVNGGGTKANGVPNWPVVVGKMRW